MPWIGDYLRLFLLREKKVFYRDFELQEKVLGEKNTFNTIKCNSRRFYLRAIPELITWGGRAAHKLFFYAWWVNLYFFLWVVVCSEKNILCMVGISRE